MLQIFPCRCNVQQPLLIMLVPSTELSWQLSAAVENSRLTSDVLSGSFVGGPAALVPVTSKMLVEWGVSMTHCRCIFALSQRDVVFI
jgi:hypothetical protein